ncbi:MAG TPA: hypothetical protein VGP10_08705 [Marisediminicola sp.]|nr:hypothetical protein [Marisediminicola sp.]
MSDEASPRPTIADVRGRTSALANCVQIAVLAPPSRIVAALAQLDVEKRQALREQLDVGPAQLRSTLVSTGVWSDLTPDEQWYLSTPPDKVPHDDWAAALGDLEALDTPRLLERLAAVDGSKSGAVGGEDA